MKHVFTMPLVSFWFCVLREMHGAEDHETRKQLFLFASETICSSRCGYTKSEMKKVDFVLFSPKEANTDEWKTMAWDLAWDFVHTGKADSITDGVPDVSTFYELGVNGVKVKKIAAKKAKPAPRKYVRYTAPDTSDPNYKEPDDSPF